MVLRIISLGPSLRSSVKVMSIDFKLSTCYNLSNGSQFHIPLVFNEAFKSFFFPSYPSQVFVLLTGIAIHHMAHPHRKTKIRAFVNLYTRTAVSHNGLSTND